MCITQERSSYVERRYRKGRGGRRVTTHSNFWRSRVACAEQMLKKVAMKASVVGALLPIGLEMKKPVIKEQAVSSKMGTKYLRSCASQYCADDEYLRFITIVVTKKGKKIRE